MGDTSRSGLRGALTTWTGKALAAALTAIVLSAVAYVFNDGFWHSAAQRLGTAAPALRAQAITDIDRFHSEAPHLPLFVIPGRSVLPRPPTEESSEGRWAWARALGGVDAEETLVRLVLTGRSAEPVILEDARVVIVARRPPIRSGVLATYLGRGGAQGLRHFEVSLDRNPSELRYIGSQGTQEAHFPLRVTDTDAEVFDILASTSACDCSWIVEIDYTAAGKDGTLRVDDHGTPFRTTAASIGANVSGSDWIGASWAPAMAWSSGAWAPVPSNGIACGPRQFGGARVVVLVRGTGGACAAPLAAAAAHLEQAGAGPPGWACADATASAARWGGVAACRGPAGATAAAVDVDRQARADAGEGS